MPITTKQHGHSGHIHARTHAHTQTSDESNVGPARLNTVLHKMLSGVQDHIRPIVECDSMPFGPRNLLKHKFQSVLKRKLQIVLLTLLPIDPNVRDSAAVEPAAAAGGQPAAMEVSTDPVVSRACGAAPQPDVSRVIVGSTRRDWSNETCSRNTN